MYCDEMFYLNDLIYNFFYDFGFIQVENYLFEYI